jgi:hypothetical protein
MNNLPRRKKYFEETIVKGASSSMEKEKLRRRGELIFFSGTVNIDGIIKIRSSVPGFVSLSSFVSIPSCPAIPSP